MYSLSKSTKFKKALKKVSKYKNFDMNELDNITLVLQKRDPVDKKYNDHKAVKQSFPEIKGMRILHLRPNICLIYKVLDDEEVIYLYDIGSHQDTGITEDLN